MPARVFFAPDCLTKGQCGGQGSSFLETESIACNRPTVIVFDHGEPGASWLACFIQYPDIQWRMIRLPHRIGTCGFSSVEQVKFLAVREIGRASCRERV